jgi:thymidylate synthase
MKGDTNIKYLEDNNIGIWRRDAFQHNTPALVAEGIIPKDLKKYSEGWETALAEYGQRIREDEEFAQRFGEGGPIYGKQWRDWEFFDKEKNKLVKIDQLGNMINGLRKKPMGKKHIVSAWQPGDVPNMSLAPCHVMYQATSDGEGNLELQLYQRSCDQFLGVPYNIASYAILTQVIAQEVGMKAKTFIHTFGDSHFYSGLDEKGKWYRANFDKLQDKVRNVSFSKEFLEVLDWIKTEAPQDKNENKYDHVTAILRQLSREPKKLPTMEIADKPFDQLEFEDFVLKDYEHDKPIRRSMAV